MILPKYLLPMLICGCCLVTVIGRGEDGPLVIVGGGEVPEVAQQRFVDLAGGAKGHIAVLPQASAREDRGDGSLEMFRKRGVESVFKVDLEDQIRARNELSTASGIWLSGGDQSKLMEALRAAEMTELVQARHRAGVPIGGTSAGAAVMSRKMITDTPKVAVLLPGNTPLGEGLGLAPQLIVDQHFIARGRLPRLLGAVLDHADLLGVGIDEETAIVVRGSKFEVLGRGSVVVIDARNATNRSVKTGQLQTADDLRLHVLRSGQFFEWK